MKFQFQIDNRPAGPVRDQWEDAAQDIVNAGYASWGKYYDSVNINTSQGACIARIIK